MNTIRAFVISSGRPLNVPKMVAHADGWPLTWVVPGDQVGDYKAAGASIVVAGGGLMASRNMALDMAQKEDRHCLQLSDDLRNLRFTETKDNKRRRTITLSDAADIMGRALREKKVMLAGVAPTDNAFFYNQPYSSNLFIVGDMVLIHKDCTLRFDAQLKLKEDYDFTCQCIATYGAVVRCNQVLATFAHRTNRGGAVAYRNEMREQEAIAYLKHKWPGKIVDNPRRANEVLLKWK